MAHKVIARPVFGWKRSDGSNEVIFLPKSAYPIGITNTESPILTLVFDTDTDDTTAIPWKVHLLDISYLANQPEIGENWRLVGLGVTNGSRPHAVYVEPA